ncbi:MAG: polysaccharide deacetylase family protein [Lentisphaerae bacterium]|nr:polysaccharide deacetylase family protein [Lentisphaerota bacterium]
MSEKTVVLTFDDCCKSHLYFVLPILQKYGFNATFFISRPQNWLSDYPEAYLSGEEIARIHQAGFEIGNHSMNHHRMNELSDEVCRSEVRELNEFLTSYGIPEPVSFAYPGGPYAANAAAILPEFGLRCARTTEHSVWDLQKTDPMRVPSFSITEKSADDFKTAIDLAVDDPGYAASILYHGVPDIHHPWCNTPEEMFAGQMKFLADNGFKVVSMRDFLNRR